MKSHNMEIIEQFTKQAIPFANMPAHLDAIELLIKMSAVDKQKTVLDVACGPGLVSCAFAPHAKFVNGIDLTKQMIIEARKLSTKKQLNNISFDIGDVSTLPYPDKSFDIVLTRYTFHHFINPKAILEEMIRVCKPNGIILIADVVLPPEKVDYYNKMERLRDPSHTSALTHQEFSRLLEHISLTNLQQSNYLVNMKLENILKSSFPKASDGEKIWDIFTKDIEDNNLGVSARLINNEIHFDFPINVYMAQKV